MRARSSAAIPRRLRPLNLLPFTPWVHQRLKHTLSPSNSPQQLHKLLHVLDSHLRADCFVYSSAAEFRQGKLLLLRVWKRILVKDDGECTMKYASLVLALAQRYEFDLIHMHSAWRRGSPGMRSFGAGSSHTERAGGTQLMVPRRGSRLAIHCTWRRIRGRRSAWRGRTTACWRGQPSASAKWTRNLPFECLSNWKSAPAGVAECHVDPQRHGCSVVLSFAVSVCPASRRVRWFRCAVSPVALCPLLARPTQREIVFISAPEELPSDTGPSDNIQGQSCAVDPTWTPLLMRHCADDIEAFAQKTTDAFKSGLSDQVVPHWAAVCAPIRDAHWVRQAQFFKFNPSLFNWVNISVASQPSNSDEWIFLDECRQQVRVAGLPLWQTASAYGRVRTIDWV